MIIFFKRANWIVLGQLKLGEGVILILRIPVRFFIYLIQFGDLYIQKRIISIDMLNVLYCKPESMEGHAHIKSRNTLLNVHSAQAQ